MRRKGEGSIYQRGDGRWVAQIVVGRYPNGRPQYRRAVRRTEAEAVTAKLELQSRDDVPDDTRTLAQYLGWWAETVLPDEVKESTEDDYRKVIDLYVVPHVGGYRLGELTRGQVQAMLRKLTATGLSPRTVQYARSVLRRALQWAVEDELIPRNVATGRMGPPQTKRRPKDLTGAEAEAVIAAARGDRLEALVVVVLALGLRKGEALALFWPDAASPPSLLDDPDDEWSVVDLETETVSVASTLKRRTTRRGGGLYVSAAKTDASSGTLPLVAGTLPALRDHRRRQAAERLAAGPEWHDHGLVFCRPDGRPLAPSWVNIWWNRVCTKAGIGHRTFHATRHTCATLLLDRGVPLEVVSAVLRHAKLSITADIYARVTQDLKRRHLGDGGGQP